MRYFLYSLLLFSYSLFAEVLKDKDIEFAINIPDNLPVYSENDRRGKSIALSFEDKKNHNLVILQAVRANDGGYTLDKMVIFKQMLKGISDKLGATASEPRVILYHSHELFVATHEIKYKNKDATATTVSYLEDNNQWRKIITLQFLSRKTPMLDKDIIKNLQYLKYEPTLH